MRHLTAFVSIMVLLLAMPVFSQEITVRFTGQLNGTDYCRLDRVVVTNLSQNWTETVTYPDSLIVLGGNDNSVENFDAIRGLVQNVPNPFDCKTQVELSLSKCEKVRIKLLDVTGKVYTEYNSTLDVGVHMFDISIANPQTYLLIATVGSNLYSIKMLNIGSGDENSIKYAGSSDCITAKLTTTNVFYIGDRMRYIGYATIDGSLVASDVVEQNQTISQILSLNFTHYFRPEVETLEATDITTSSAKLHGSVSNDGSLSIISRGFYYGTNAYNLTENVECSAGTGNFAKILTNLSSNTTYYYKSYATNAIGTSYGEVKQFTTSSPNAPTVQTSSATNITLTGATISGNVTSDGGATITTRGFMYGTDASNLTQNVQSGSGTGTYTKNITGLDASTTYYYKAYATNVAGTSYGEVKQFTTSSPNQPTVQTGSATNITLDGVTLSGNVTADGGSTVTDRGFMYGISSSNLTQSAQSESGTGSYTKNITGLDASTTYYYKAYATNAAGTSYGQVKQFTTSSPNTPTVQTVSAENITSTGAILSGNVTADGGSTVTDRGFIYGTGPYTYNLTESIQSGTGTGSYTKNITGLDASTTYYYKAYATNAIGTSYGEVKQFTTLAPPTTGTQNGHDWVDLGLPSGTRWATCNVGANNPEEYGDYFAWGETFTKTTYSSDTYTYVMTSSTPLSLPASDDAASVNWGLGWRMPTPTELSELKNNCTITQTTQNEVLGHLFTGPNGNSIFLPSGGYYVGYTGTTNPHPSDGHYWSNCRGTSANDYTPEGLHIYYGQDTMIDTYSKWMGLTVRPVCVQ
ncbi:MAG: hypothetical protein IK025_06125 [Bacteroidales bacterium]|nr:hypothetical protein [Bacteroidales bacterium]